MPTIYLFNSTNQIGTAVVSGTPPNYIINLINLNQPLGITNYYSDTSRINDISNSIVGFQWNGGKALSVAQGSKNFVSIVIPDSVTYIGIGAFRLSLRLTSVIFSSRSNLQRIDANAFNGCNLLSTIIIPSTVTTIGDYAFYTNVSLTSVTFSSPSSLKSLGNSTFYGCNQLPTITIPTTTTLIGSYAFGGCTILSSAIIDGLNSSLVDISSNAFYLSGLTRITIPVSLSKIGVSAFEGCLSMTSVDFDQQCDYSFKNIGSKAFYNCVSLNSLYLDNPNNPTAFAALTEIGYQAFSGCSALTSFVIPVNVSAFYDLGMASSLYLSDLIIQGQAFVSNPVINGIMIPSAYPAQPTDTLPNGYSPPLTNASNQFSNISSGIFLRGVGGGSTATIQGLNIKNVVFGPGVTMIPDGYFGIVNDPGNLHNRSYFISVTSIKANYVTYIGYSSFSACIFLNSFSATSLQVISPSAFSSDVSLSLIIPPSLTRIDGYYNFQYVGNLIINNSTILDTLFSNSVPTYNPFIQLQNLFFTADNTLVASGFFIRPKSSTITIGSNIINLSSPSGTNGLFLNSQNFLNSMIDLQFSLPSSVTSIGSYAFADVLVSVTLPSSVTSIGANAFSNCATKLTSVIFNCPNLSSLGMTIFSGCTSLTKIVLPLNRFISTKISTITSFLFGATTPSASLKITYAYFTGTSPDFYQFGGNSLSSKIISIGSSSDSSMSMIINSVPINIITKDPASANNTNYKVGGVDVDNLFISQSSIGSSGYTSNRGDLFSLYQPTSSFTVSQVTSTPNSITINIVSTPQFVGTYFANIYISSTSPSGSVSTFSTLTGTQSLLYNVPNITLDGNNNYTFTGLNKLSYYLIYFSANYSGIPSPIFTPINALYTSDYLPYTPTLVSFVYSNDTSAIITIGVPKGTNISNLPISYYLAISSTPLSNVLPTSCSLISTTSTTLAGLVVNNQSDVPGSNITTNNISFSLSSGNFRTTTYYLYIYSKNLAIPQSSIVNYSNNYLTLISPPF